MPLKIGRTTKRAVAIFFLAALSALPAAANDAVEAALKAAAAQLKLTLPRDLNESVTATDVLAEGMTVTYVLDIKPGHEITDMAVLESQMKQKFCASEAHAMTGDGVIVVYEYWTPAPDRKLRGTLKIAGCP